MTLEEARELKPGDHVFLKVKVEGDEFGRPIFSHGALYVSYNNGNIWGKRMIVVLPRTIRKECA